MSPLFESPTSYGEERAEIELPSLIDAFLDLGSDFAQKVKMLEDENATLKTLVKKQKMQVCEQQTHMSNAQHELYAAQCEIASLSVEFGKIRKNTQEASPVSTLRRSKELVTDLTTNDVVEVDSTSSNESPSNAEPPSRRALIETIADLQEQVTEIKAESDSQAVLIRALETRHKKMAKSHQRRLDKEALQFNEVVAESERIWDELQKLRDLHNTSRRQMRLMEEELSEARLEKIKKFAESEKHLSTYQEVMDPKHHGVHV